MSIMASQTEQPPLRIAIGTHFLGNNKIPMLAGKFYTDLKMAYTGGATDMFIPTNMTKNNTAVLSSSSILSKVFKNAWKVICILYYYDVNSLYPYIMSQFEILSLTGP